MSLRTFLLGIVDTVLGRGRPGPLLRPGGGVPPLLPAPTIEIFSQPGHGRSSYLWALLCALRQLSLVWPDYLCWSLDEPTTLALRTAHEALAAGVLPPRGVEGGDPARYSLVLQRLERWGRRPLVVWDRRDPVFSPAGHAAAGPTPAGSLPATAAGGAAPSWGSPALWLISLPDLDAADEQLIDLRLEELIRARMAAGQAPNRNPLQLIVVLTKADAIADLPAALRGYLKEDHLWEQGRGSDTAARPAAVPAAGLPSAQHYLAALWRVDAEIKSWLQHRVAGQLLLRRAAECHVDLRCTIVSATGSGIAAGRDGVLPWTPRRVLDPLFWALELSPPHTP